MEVPLILINNVLVLYSRSVRPTSRFKAFMPETRRNPYCGSLLGNSCHSAWLEGDSDVIYTECSIFAVKKKKSLKGLFNKAKSKTNSWKAQQRLDQ